MSHEKTQTLEDAKKWLRARLKDGARCPCCTQMAKIYRRQIYSSMAIALIKFYRIVGNTVDFVHITTSGDKYFRLLTTGDFAKLAYWGLIEEKPKGSDEKQKRTSGSWRITPAGLDFILGNRRVPKYVLIYDGKMLRFDETEMVSIRDCLGQKFSYEELMSF